MGILDVGRRFLGSEPLIDAGKKTLKNFGTFRQVESGVNAITMRH